MLNLGGVFFPLGQGDGYTQLDQMDLGKNECACCLLHEKGKSPKMTSCGPSNFKGDGLHLNFLKKTQLLLVTQFSST
jgi:hypothetical protein